MPTTSYHRSRLRLFAVTLATTLTLLILLPGGLAPRPAAASSHREAPLIAEDPLADNTDVYAFVSPDKPDTVTLVANYVPFESPSGGPNFYRFGDDVLYQIKVDNNGDAKADVVFSFRFKTKTLDPKTFLYNTGPITFANGVYKNWNRPQTYDVTMFRRDDDERVSSLGKNLLTPPVNVGPKSTPDYHTLANAAIHTLPRGIKVFAGPRDDPFFVDLGRAFDLLSVNPAGGTDYVAGLNVNSIVLQVPKDLLWHPDGPGAADAAPANMAEPSDDELAPADEDSTLPGHARVPMVTVAGTGQQSQTFRAQHSPEPIIGVWATASRRTLTILRGNGTKASLGPWVQVSRQGHPLVNEVVNPLGQKDLFNATRVGPGNDLPFLPNVLNPEVARLFVALGIDPNAPTTNRQDLVTVFLTGVPGLNKPSNVSPAEVLRLNINIPPSSADPNKVNRLGVLGGQLDGFPNGRRLADDVADIELQAVAGILCQPGGPLAGSNPCRTTKVNPALGDGVNQNDQSFLTTFPYLADAVAP